MENGEGGEVEGWRGNMDEEERQKRQSKGTVLKHSDFLLLHFYYIWYSLRGKKKVALNTQTQTGTTTDTN